MSVPVLDSNKNPLMPCSEKRARKLMEKNTAKPFWFKGIFCIILQKEPSFRYTQKIVVGIDPGRNELCQNAKKEDCILLAKQIWCGGFSSPYLKEGVSDVR